MYISLSFFIISLFSLHALMNKYKLNNGVVKLNSTLNLSIGTQSRLSSRAVTGIEGTCW